MPPCYDTNLSMIQYDASMLWHFSAIGIAIIRYKSQYAEQDGSKGVKH